MKMTVPMMALSFLCVAIGMVPVLILPLVKGPLQLLCHGHTAGLFEYSRVNSFCAHLTVATLLFSSIFALVLLGRRLLVRGKTARTEVTWDCGFFKSSPRLQYTASSFAFPLVDFFSWILRTKTHGARIKDYFPAPASLSAHTSDISERHFYAPFYHLTKTISNITFIGLRKQDVLTKSIYDRGKIFLGSQSAALFRRIKARLFFLVSDMRRWLSGIRAVQNGDMRLYLLYIIAALCVLLVLVK